MSQAAELPHFSRHPSTALQSGSLLVFPSPWSSDHGAAVSTSFPSLDAGRDPPLQCEVARSLRHLSRVIGHIRRAAVAVRFACLRPLPCCCSLRMNGCGSPHPPHRNAGALRSVDVMLREHRRSDFAVHPHRTSARRGPQWRSDTATALSCARVGVECKTGGSVPIRSSRRGTRRFSARSLAACDTSHV